RHRFPQQPLRDPQFKTAVLIAIAPTVYNGAVRGVWRRRILSAAFPAAGAENMRKPRETPRNQPPVTTSRTLAIGAGEMPSGGRKGPSCEAINPITRMTLTVKMKRAANCARASLRCVAATLICAIKAIQRTHDHFGFSAGSELNARRSP